MPKTTTSKTNPFAMFDADQFVAVQQRNVDAVTSAGQIVVDGVRALALRHGEMMQNGVDEFLSASHQVWGAKPGEHQPADQVAKAKTAYETAVNNARELTEIAVKAQNEAFGVLTRCWMANLDDMKSLAKTA